MDSVSICIPTYNGERHLDACIQSALAQTYGNVGIIIVDDGSSDSTREIVGRYAHAAPRIRVLENGSNLGLVENWNRCIELSSGEWIKFVFQDDFIDPTCIELLVDAGNKTGRGFVVCRRDFIFDGVPTSTKQLYERFPTMDSVAGHRTDLNPEDVARAALELGCVNFIGEPTSALIHRKIFAKVGNFRTDLIQYCDLEFWLRTGVQMGIAYVPEKLAHFRVHEESTSAKNTASKAFRMDVVDPLILAREFAFAPAFAPLRGQAASQGRDLVREFFLSLTDHLCMAQQRLDRDRSTCDRYPQELDALRCVYDPTKMPRWARARLHIELARARAKRAFERHIGWRLPPRRGTN